MYKTWSLALVLHWNLLLQLSHSSEQTQAAYSLWYLPAFGNGRHRSLRYCVIACNQQETFLIAAACYFSLEQMAYLSVQYSY